ncbi:Nif3-like dinuclear metal center hexameric protein [Hufsiella ginkgonis]|uniref:GTP cyclohydrolase 1 type 2 homolog n=1 Tax=Hufsiella ginkgonis TaxID=2695274 RepID=A0A7K1XT20_9SPHI|nr:Nif3-like dinuclear metal center hexameric protein [Hufsiella ginkgonis]MXV14145.1 Nif3-like dinuclear metal center hexameric protein [Hufsiella ginkgonis]
MKLSELTACIESLAPLSYQEDYDNAGLLVGSADSEVNSALISLDCTEDIVDEAIRTGSDLIISHHPIVFKGLKKFNGKTYVERVVMKAIRHNIALYAVHTNLDSIHTGVNAMICEKLGIQEPRILSPKNNLLKKLVTFCPFSQAAQVREALFTAGAGQICDYDSCSYNTDGTGTFRGNENTEPFAGEPGKLHTEPETRIEVIYPITIERNLLKALAAAHPYEEVAYDLYPLANTHPLVGPGMIGNLAEAQDELDFLRFVKSQLGASVIRHTKLLGKKVKKVAVCGGAGGFLLPHAIAAGADVFVTADYKYHEFFDAEEKIVIADAGHFESEQFTQQLLFGIIRKKFPTFALRLTEINTNPINYLI